MGEKGVEKADKPAKTCHGGAKGKWLVVRKE